MSLWFKDISTQICRDMSSGDSENEIEVVVKKSAYTESDRRYYQKNKERCLELSRPHKKAYWLAHKDELKAKRREYYLTVEKPKRIAKKLESSGDKIDEFGV
jgi:phosphorylcholine metabolism protein LicD